AVLADGAEYSFGAVPADPAQLSGPSGYVELVKTIRAIAAREAEEIEHRVPKLLRQVGGYNLDLMLAERRTHPPHEGEGRGGGGMINMAHLLVGSEGTLAWSRRLHLDLSPLPKHKTLGVCHFPAFHQSMDAPRHIVKLGPAAVELV